VQTAKTKGVRGSGSEKMVGSLSYNGLTRPTGHWGKAWGHLTPMDKLEEDFKKAYKID
jgi:hypothetical protein